MDRRSGPGRVDDGQVQCHKRKVSIRSLRIIGRAVALVTMLAVAVVTLPTATAAVVTCCCGDHDAHHDCGCVDCPAGDGHRGGDGAPAMKSCQTRPAEVTLAPSSLHPPPATTTLLLVATPAPPRAPAMLIDRDAEAPPSPPPRG